MIFFVSIGTIFDVNSVVSNLAPLFVVLLVLLSFKVFVIIAIIFGSKYMLRQLEGRSRHLSNRRVCFLRSTVGVKCRL
jgi:Kef-type K+ transport system membrane component KefB